MIKWVLLPFSSWLMLLPVIVVMETWGGRGTIGDDAADEYLAVLFAMTLLNIFLSIRKK
tara:strand:+ start:1543 stop:1719 length:177 start_codon:yes stop_codon:yes gene_type:complete